MGEFAETPSRFFDVPPGISVEKYADERVCIMQGPTWATISAVRTSTKELPELVADVRERVPADREPTWHFGPSTRPRNAYGELKRCGFRLPRNRQSTLIALALTEEPERPEGVEVIRIESFEHFAAASELAWEAFDEPEDRRAKNRARLEEFFEEERRIGVPAEFLAFLDGKPAATAAAVPSDRGVFLAGGATASWARGRGLYRALVRARWDYAIEHKTPALVTHANPKTSYPILKRLGFADVCRIRRLQDSAAG